LNAAIYDDDFNEHFINDIVLSDRESEIRISSTISNYKMLILNHDDQAYLKIRYDKTTLSNLLTCLSIIPNSLTRAHIWRQMWNNLLDQ